MNGTENYRGINRVDEVGFAVRRLVDDKKKEGSGAFTLEERRLLSRLLSQMEELLEEDPNPSSRSIPSNPLQRSSKDDMKESNVPKDIDELDEIANELRNVRRQNALTHSLLYVLLAVTTFWQLSQVSVLLAMRNTVTQPFRCVGRFVSGLFVAIGGSKRRRNLSLPSNNDQLEAPVSLPLTIGIPQSSQVDLPAMLMDGNGKRD